MKNKELETKVINYFEENGFIPDYFKSNMTKKINYNDITFFIYTILNHSEIIRINITSYKTKQKFLIESQFDEDIYESMIEPVIENFDKLMKFLDFKLKAYFLVREEYGYIVKEIMLEEISNKIALIKNDKMKFYQSEECIDHLVRIVKEYKSKEARRILKNLPPSLSRILHKKYNESILTD